MTDRFDFEINWFNVNSVLTRTTVHLVTFFLHTSVLYYSNAANINFSLIINLYSLTAFFTAIAFYCFFHEKLTRWHIIGMLFIFSCVYITSQSDKGGSVNTEDSNESHTSVMVPVTLAVIATMGFTVHSVVCRYVISNQGSIDEGGKNRKLTSQ